MGLADSLKHALLSVLNALSQLASMARAEGCSQSTAHGHLLFQSVALA